MAQTSVLDSVSPVTARSAAKIEQNQPSVKSVNSTSTAPNDYRCKFKKRILFFLNEDVFTFKKQCFLQKKLLFFYGRESKTKAFIGKL